MHMRLLFGFTFLIVVTIVTVGCDKAKADFEECEKLEADGKLVEAAKACAKALKADPDSESGKAAKAKLGEVKKQERAALLESKEPSDWEKLTKKYPESSEAEKAHEKLKRHASICADLPTWMDRLDAEGKELSKVFSKYRARNKKASGAVELMKVAEGLSKECAAKATLVRQVETELDGHKTLEGEEAILSEASGAFGAVADIYDRYSNYFKAGSEAWPYIIELTKLAKVMPLAASVTRKILNKKCRYGPDVTIVAA